MGGEWGGAALLAAENAPKGRRGWYGAFPQFGPAVGFFAASGSFLLLSAVLDDESFRSWGWRVPFLASAVLVLIGLLVRLKIAETPAFAEVLRKQERSSMPLVDMFRRAPGRLLLGGGTVIICYVLFYTATTFMLSYGTTTLKIPRDHMLVLSIVTIWAMVASTAASARASDVWGCRPVLIVGCLVALAAGLLLFPLVASGDVVLVAVALALMLAAMGAVYGPLGAYLPELFDVRYRYSASSFAYNLGGGLAPIIAAELAASHGISAVGWYVAGAAVLSLLCIVALPETKGANLGPTSVAT